MSSQATEALVEVLAAQAQPVAPLAPPARRAAITLATVVLVGTALVLAAGDLPGLLARYSGRQALMLVEMGAMLATAVLAVTGAFMLSVPGRSRRWFVAPLAAFLVWLAASGIGCFGDLSRLGSTWWGIGDGPDCLAFLVAASLPIAGLLFWRLSRARPFDPLPVALLGGLGAAALAALLLQFFHPFGLTLIDLGVHFGAIGLVAAIAALSRRRTLAPA